VIDAVLRVAGGVVRVLLAPGSGEGLWGFLFFRVLFLFGVFLLRVLLFGVFLLRILLFRVFLVRVLRSAFVQGSWRQLVAPCRSWHYVTGTVFRPQFLAILCIVFTEHLMVGLTVLARDESAVVGRVFGGRRLNMAPCWDLTPDALADFREHLLAILCIVFTEHLLSGLAILTREKSGAVDGTLDKRWLRPAAKWWSLLEGPAEFRELFSAVSRVVRAKERALRVPALSCDKRGGVCVGGVNREGGDQAGEQSHQTGELEDREHCVE
jgi:hypothetical protein